MDKLAITGITGKNGRILFEYIVNNQDEIAKRWSSIRFLVRDKKKCGFILGEKLLFAVELVEGDVRDFNTVKELLFGCDTVLHIAGIQYSMNIINASVQNGVLRQILVHTAAVYSKHKAAGEEYRQIDEKVQQLAKEHNLRVTVLRPTMIYGSMKDHNISVFTDMVNKWKWIPVIDGAHYEIQPVHCRDLGKAFFQVLMNPEICDGKDYILSGDRPIELRDLFLMIAETMNLKRSFINCPYPIAYIGAVMLYKLSRKKKDYREKVQRMCESRAYSHELATLDFGYSPIPLEEGIQEEVELYRATGLIKG